jgi:hypothetical protein
MNKLSIYFLSVSLPMRFRLLSKWHLICTNYIVLWMCWMIHIKCHILVGAETLCWSSWTMAMPSSRVGSVHGSCFSGLSTRRYIRVDRKRPRKFTPSMDAILVFGWGLQQLSMFFLLSSTFKFLRNFGIFVLGASILLCRGWAWTFDVCIVSMRIYLSQYYISSSK